MKDIDSRAKQIAAELANVRLSELLKPRTRELSTAEASKIFEGLMADDDDEPAIIDRLDDMNDTLNAMRVACNHNASQVVRIADDHGRLKVRYSAMVESRDQWRSAFLVTLFVLAGFGMAAIVWAVNR